MTSQETYTTCGSVRGCCGHEHRSIKSALDCLSRDRHGCRAQGGYSDRSIVYADHTPLSGADRDEMEREEYA